MKQLTCLLSLTLLALLLLASCTSNTALGAEVASPEEMVAQAQDTAPADLTLPQASELETMDTAEELGPTDETLRPEGWDEETHSKETEPDYEVVFPQDEVNRLDITISSENWTTMMADMSSRYGEFGAKQRQAPGAEPVGPESENPPPASIQPPQIGDQAPDAEQARPGRENPPPADGLPPRNEDKAPALGNRPPGRGGMMEGDESNPIWVPVTIEFENITWTNVGLRFKGNSSLSSSWSSGIYKLPLKLDFDEFEDEYPEIDDQRFYGFKQLTLSSNFKDSSFLHEKVAADIFREAGVPAAQTAYYQVYLDYGEGPIYFGLYTMVEVVDDTLIETQFVDDSGNVYKPSGAGATFAAGSFSEAAFDKESNQDEADYSDILALYEVLHAETRTSDPQSWRSNLEATFDVENFLQYLAINTVIQNWDTYGVMSHNYYLYHDPTTDLLTWIPWDNNEALNAENTRGALSLSLDEVTAEWPLIRYLLDDPVYHAEYVENVGSVVTGVFTPETITARYQELHDLIYPYVVGPEGEIEAYSNLASAGAFDASLDELIRHAESRYQAANEYLESIR